ncbi:hypothetical protein [Arsenicicoccus dermatophilus]|uniref:hypothetical protein n=1 Tax=Arsenicicoccus dermatophilus TaxID=1076331 RepID=UPI001F4D16F2|nr:hypothetical protein [Arsenicicoccus dermatophilus]MCH8614140.1 hypothetical protein [Arsenicicoccus dermatophilus]
MVDAVDGSGIARTAGDTSDPRQGLRAVTALRRLADRLELAQVEAALGAGLSWAEIADALGVSRQAVHKKFKGRVRPELTSRPGDPR